MYQITPFVSELHNIIKDTLINYPNNRDIVMQVLDGRPSKELRKLVPLKSLRESGAFFTGSQLRNIAISEKFASTINDTSVVLDPTCGGGDLLLSCAPYLPFSLDLFETLIHWQSSLLGVDIHSEFVEIAKLRLILKAITLGANITNSSLYAVPSDIFNGILTGSIFDNLEVFQRATHIVLNPPFYMMTVPRSCQWSNGKVNASAVFLETCVNQAKKGTRIAAILPDVLRSGTRYKKWRDFIESKCEIEAINLYGQFDAWADVDVFVLEMVVKSNPDNHSCKWVSLNEKSEIIVADKFYISIGSVVEFRDPFIGPSVKFIRPHGLPAWGIVNQIEICRLYTGKTFQSPFVVVRRTSRQGDKYRAVGTIIDINDDVAVENHLIVLKPKDGNLSTCQELLTILQNEKTNVWINEMIRCRHLTIKSLADLPWWS